MTDKELLQAIRAELGSMKEDIKEIKSEITDIKEIKREITEIKDRLESMEESLEEVRSSTNALIGWAEKASMAATLPLPNIGD